MNEPIAKINIMMIKDMFVRYRVTLMAIAYLLSITLRPLFLNIPFISTFDIYLGVISILVVVVFLIERSMTRPFYEDIDNTL